LEQFIVLALVWPLAVVVLHELRAEIVHVPLAEDDKVVQAFLLHGLDEWRGTGA
jgi:hypothetical protein